jgi:hypothetical protein
MREIRAEAHRAAHRGGGLLDKLCYGTPSWAKRLRLEEPPFHQLWLEMQLTFDKVP